MTDEKYMFIQDCKDKKITARSARYKKTHAGKSGAVKFPSDFMTKKEREAMNGECKSYRMNEPVKWEEFKTWPKDIQEDYIKLLKQKFGAPLSAISIMMGLDRCTLPSYVRTKKLNVGECKSGRREWNSKEFEAWCGGAKDGTVKPSETPVEEEIDISKEDEPVAVNEESDIEIVDFAADRKRLEEELKKLEENAIYTYEHDYNCNQLKVEPNCFNDNVFEPTESKCETKTVIPCNGEMTFQGNVDDILRTISKLLDGRQVRLEVEWEVLG